LHPVFFKCNILENFDESEVKIFTGYNRVRNKELSVSSYLISLVNCGVLYVGFQLPSVKMVAEFMGVSRNTVIKAFKEMSSQGYLFLQNGVRSVIRHPSYGPDSDLVEDTDTIILDNSFVRVCHLTIEMVTAFKRELQLSYENTLPGRQNRIYEPLRLTLCEQLNRFQKTSYLPSNIYYMHDYQSLIRCIGAALHIKGAGIIIPSIVHHIVRRAFESAGLKIIEVDTDLNGYSVAGLARACAVNKVVGIYLMPNINYADCTNTSVNRMKEIFMLREEYQLKLVIDDWYRPWLGEQRSFVLEIAKANLEILIYLKPLTYLYEEMGRMYLVAASDGLIDKIRTAAKKYGKQAYYSVAVAADHILNGNLYTHVLKDTQSAMEELKLIVNEVFGSTGFWKEYGFKLESGPRLYIVPIQGKFKPQTYAISRKQGISIVNPENYTSTGYPLRAIIADLSNLVGKRGVRPAIVKIERVFRTLCIISPGD